MPAKITAGSAQAKTLAALSNMELRGTTDVAAYAASVRAIAYHFALELDVTAHELQVVLGKAKGSMMDRFQARMAARRVVRKLRAAAEDARSVGDNAARFWADYTRTYAEVINPDRKTRDTWQFTEKPAAKAK
jgi:hypothetical protein